MTDYGEYLGLDLDEDQKMILEMVAQLSSELLAPAADVIDRDEAIPANVRATLAESGLFGLRAPETFGGVDLDDSCYQFSLATLAHGSASVALDVLVQSSLLLEPLAKFALDDEGISAWAESVVSGEARGALAWQESSNSLSNSDLKTELRTIDGEIQLSGVKNWVLGAPEADRFLVLAKEGDYSSWFMVAADAAGVEIGKKRTRLGMRGISVAAVEFTNVAIAESNRIGTVGNGKEILEFISCRAQVGLVALATGLIAAARDAAAQYATERRQFKRPIADFEAIREKLAGAESAHASAASLLASCARLSDGGGGHDRKRLHFGMAARIQATDLAMKVADDALQTFGGYGYSQEYPVERFYRDARYLALAFGGNDPIRLRLARSILPSSDSASRKSD
ncbi:MAG: acyl-CoA dehydrogenase family protein [Planctomycetota bacterium]